MLTGQEWHSCFVSTWKNCFHGEITEHTPPFCFDRNALQQLLGLEEQTGGELSTDSILDEYIW